MKKKRTQQRKRNLISRLLPALGGGGTAKRGEEGLPISDFTSCLIQEANITLGVKLGDGSFGVVRRGTTVFYKIFTKKNTLENCFLQVNGPVRVESPFQWRSRC